MGQTGRRSIATYILAVKIVWAAAHFHGFGVALARPWNTSVNKALKVEPHAKIHRRFIAMCLSGRERDRYPNGPLRMFWGEG